MIDDNSGNRVAGSVCAGLTICGGHADGSVCTSSGTGACARSGHWHCPAASCDATPGTPTSETCNGIDDDCNGLIDDRGGVSYAACMSGGSRTLHVTGSSALASLCTMGPWTMAIWDASAVEYDFAIETDYTMPAGWASGDYAIGMRCGGVYRDFTPYTGMNITATGITRLTLGANDLTPITSVQNPLWAHGSHIIVPIFF